MDGIDNILAKPIDPLFLGLMIGRGYSIASKSIFKEKALSKSAVFCRVDGKPNILGYEYITEEISNSKREDGKYLYRDENILEHIMTLDAVEKVAGVQLKYHRAFRKNTYLDVNSKNSIYSTENSFKFEKFIFDAFSYFDDMLLLRVSKKEFAPIKDLDGAKKAIELYNKNLEDINEISNTKSS